MFLVVRLGILTGSDRGSLSIVRGGEAELRNGDGEGEREAFLGRVFLLF